MKDFHLVSAIFVQAGMIGQTKIKSTLLFKMNNLIFNHLTLKITINHEQMMIIMVNNLVINMIEILIMVKKGKN